MERKVGHELRKVQLLLHRHIEASRIATGNELTNIQNHVLSFVFKNSSKDIFQKDIEKELNIRRSTATEILNTLERNDYIIRQSVTYDARLKKIVLTKKSIDLQDQISNHIRATEKILRKGISKEDLETFFYVIDQMKTNLE